jgi:hypothetical protein
MTVAALMVRSSLDAIPSDSLLTTKFRKQDELDGVNEKKAACTPGRTFKSWWSTQDQVRNPDQIDFSNREPASAGLIKGTIVYVPRSGA